MRITRLYGDAGYHAGMGQRDDLLAGARQCLIDKGYAHTTARDIVAVTGANLAAIGYHFGTKDALLNAAVLEAFEEWGSSIENASTLTPAATAEARLREFLDGLLSAAAQQHALLVASVQAYALAEFAPEVRAQLAATYAKARRELAAMVLGVPPEDVTPGQAASTGSLIVALINGAVLQWLVDPHDAPKASDLMDAMRTLNPEVDAG